MDTVERVLDVSDSVSQLIAKWSLPDELESFRLEIPLGSRTITNLTLSCPPLNHVPNCHTYTSFKSHQG